MIADESSGTSVADLFFAFRGAPLGRESVSVLARSGLSFFVAGLDFRGDCEPAIGFSDRRLLLAITLEVFGAAADVEGSPASATIFLEGNREAKSSP